LQQSQYRVAYPAVPVVGGVQATVLLDEDLVDDDDALRELEVLAEVAEPEPGFPGLDTALDVPPPACDPPVLDEPRMDVPTCEPELDVWPDPSLPADGPELSPADPPGSDAAVPQAATTAEATTSAVIEVTFRLMSKPLLRGCQSAACIGAVPWVSIPSCREPASLWSAEDRAYACWRYKCSQCRRRVAQPNAYRF
jgi:hypothetical protein